MRLMIELSIGMILLGFVIIFGSISYTQARTIEELTDENNYYMEKLFRSYNINATKTIPTPNKKINYQVF